MRLAAAPAVTLATLMLSACASAPAAAPLATKPAATSTAAPVPAPVRATAASPREPEAGKGRQRGLPDTAPGPQVLLSGSMDAFEAFTSRLDELLDTALEQQVEPDLWADAGQTLAEARAFLVDGAGNSDVKIVARNTFGTIDALMAWRALRETAALDRSLDPEENELRQGWRAAFEQALITQLTHAQGHWQQTTHALIAILFETQRQREASDALAAALEHAPANPRLNALVRTWRDAIAEPQALIAQLDASIEAAGSGAEPDREARIRVTQGYLALRVGTSMDLEEDPAAAAGVFEQAAAFFERALATGTPDVSDWELASRRAECLVNAGGLRLQLAQRALASAGLAAAEPELQAAERDYSGALSAVPADADATSGLALTGDAFYRSGSPEAVREFFGRIARQFDNPEWWNNYAFFCRETEQYEESYAAYEKCIALEPDNARWVNDTGLILLYHLHRDLDHAEELFRRAWELGRKVCDNPFASDDVRAENLSAYGDALLNLARLHADRGDLQQAQGFVEELLEASPERPDARQMQTEIDEALAAPTVNTPVPGKES